MRTLLVSTTLMSLSTVAFAGTLSMSDMVGKFKGTPGALPASITIEIFADGHMTAVKKIIAQKAVRCEGSARVVRKIIVADVSCDDGSSQVVNLDMSNVDELQKFSAPLWTKSDRSDLRVMNFKKLQ